MPADQTPPRQPGEASTNRPARDETPAAPDKPVTPAKE